MIIGSAWSADGIEEVGDTDGMGVSSGGCGFVSSAFVCLTSWRAN